MSGDFSRSSFDRAKAFSLVRLQQGRLLSDADFNEQGDLLRDAERLSARAIIGPVGFPQDNAGFGLTEQSSLGGFLLSQGTAFVSGRPVHCPGAQSLQIRRKSGSGASIKWIAEAGPPLEVGDVLSKSQDGSGPIVRVTKSARNEDGEAQFEVTPALSPQSLTQVWRLATLDPERGDLPEALGRYLAYLEVWDASITAIDDTDLLEVAFDGPDTATRDRLSWRVRFALEGDLIEAGLGDAPLTCADVAGEFDPFGDRALLAARSVVSESEAGPCTLPPDAGYRSVENHLYRLEVHVPRAGGAPLYKWSRDNGAHRTRYTRIEDGALLVDSLGRDPVTIFKSGDWIEIQDDAAREANEAGFFAQIADASGQRVALAQLLHADDLTPLTAGGEPNLGALPQAATIRRWEGGVPTPVDPAADWVELELGIEVRFREGALLHGDYWTIPARSLTGDVEWPVHPITGEPLDTAPQGLERAYAPLGFVSFSDGDGWSVESDCRVPFAPLADQVLFDYVSGDGQQAMPNETAPETRVDLPQPLKVSVTRGRQPVEGTRVRFQIAAGNGRLGGTQTQLDVITDSEGIAQTQWAIDGADALHTALAFRIDADGERVGTPVEFAATLSRARSTSFDPTNAPDLAGALNVQDAIEQLARIQNGGCETHIITPATDWVSVLASIPQGANVSICFAPGRYETEETVVVAKLGHVRLNGSGKGVEIVALKSECAIEFVDCQSVVARGVSCSAMALPDAITKSGQKLQRRGALTITGAPEVDVAQCHFACGPGKTDERTALTIRARPDEDIAAPMRCVRVVNCEIEVGYRQEGILVHDAIDLVIADNCVSVLPIPDGFSTAADNLSKKQLAQLNGALISNIRTGDAVLGKDVREVRVGDFSVTFLSAIPQSEWNGAVRGFPPPAQASRNETAVRSYWDDLQKAIVEEPDRLPSFNDALKFVGDGNVDRVDAASRQRMLVLKETGIAKRADMVAGGRNVLIERNDQSVAFASPVSNRQWQLIMKRAEDDQPVKPGEDLVRYVRDVGDRLMLGTLSRSGFNEFSRWCNSNTGSRRTMAHQAIICAGSQLDTVRVSGNIIRGFNTAIRVALSHENRSFNVGSATIEDNVCELTTPGPELRWLHGVYVGNVDRLLARNNRLMHWRVSGHHNSPFEFGFWVFGFLGTQLLFKDNRIEIAKRGFRVKKLLEDGSGGIPDEEWDDYHWLMADNQVIGAAWLDSTNPFHLMKYRDNYGAPHQVQ